MAASCGPLTLVCVFLLAVVAVSVVFAGQQDAARASDDVSLARSMRSVGNRRLGRGNDEVTAVDPTSGGRRGGSRRRGGNRGNRRNNGGRRRGGGGGGGRGRGRGRGRGGGQRPGFSRREKNLIGRLTAASTQFSLQLYSALKDDNPDLIFSPYSIHTALTMTYLGARERTAKQMLKVLGLKRLKRQKAHLAYAALTSSLAQTGNVTLSVANAVYVKPNLPIEEAFRQGLQTMYRAEFDHFDYEAEGGPEAPINTWVATKTGDKIQNLLQQGTIDGMTAMIIVNAIYFKGNWKDKFDVAATTQQMFHKDAVSTTPVQMMTRTGNYNYTRAGDLDAHVLELPYQDGRFSMVVILPVTRHALSRVEDALTLDVLNGHLGRMRSTRVELHLPRFKSESKLSLKPTLKSMGMTNPFSGRAKFTGICTVAALYISDVIHQAVVEVSEEGTEAAASTAIIIGLRSFPRQTVQVKADHPFLYAIRDNLSKTVLFMGKYSAQQ